MSEGRSGVSRGLVMAKRSRRSRRGGGALRRRVNHRIPKQTFLVFCEGERTEPDYLTALKLEPAVREIAAVDIRVAEGTGAVPLPLVTQAADARTRNSRDYGEVDEVWCLFDVETWCGSDLRPVGP